ncbi:hypothetical protein [Asaia platycodi]
MNTVSRPRFWAALTAVIFALCGIYLTLGGVWLLSYGDTPYYAVCGIALLATAYLVWTGRPAAFWLYTLIILGSLAWAIGEIGIDFWSLVPRGDVIVILGIWLLLPFVSRQITTSRLATFPLAGSVLLALIVVVVAFVQDPSDKEGNLPTDKIAAAGSDAPQVPMATGRLTVVPSMAIASRR